MFMMIIGLLHGRSANCLGSIHSSQLQFLMSENKCPPDDECFDTDMEDESNHLVFVSILFVSQKQKRTNEVADVANNDFDSSSSVVSNISNTVDYRGEINPSITDTPKN